MIDTRFKSDNIMMKRLYGIDLYKALAMLMVVMLHIMGRGGVTEACVAYGSHSFIYIFEQLFYNVCMCSVDCFVLATGFLMIGRSIKVKRIVYLWLQVVFYSLLMTGIAWFFFPSVNISVLDWVKAIMPLTYEQYWFVTAYVGLFFTIPVLNRVFVGLDQKDAFKYLAGGFVLLSLFPSIIGRDVFKTSFGYSYLWFIYLFMLGGGIRQYEVWKKIHFGKSVIFFMISLIAAFSLQVLWKPIVKLLGSEIVWGQYTSPFILIEVIALLVMFAKIQITSQRMQAIIGYIAPSIFAVYVLHSNGVFRRMIDWNGKFCSLADYGVVGVIVGIILVALIIFIASIIIDIIRRYVVNYLFGRIL